MDDGCKGCACCMCPDIFNCPAGCSDFDDVCLNATALSKTEYETTSKTVTDANGGMTAYGSISQVLCECWNINR